MNPRGYFLAISTLLGFVAGLILARDYRPDPLPPAYAVPTWPEFPTPVPSPTGPVVVVLTTYTPTPHRPSSPVHTPTPRPTMLACDTPVPNQDCQWRFPPTAVPTPTTIPVCKIIERIDGLRCRWPTPRPTATPESTATRPVPTSALLEGMR